MWKSTLYTYFSLCTADTPPTIFLCSLSWLFIIRGPWFWSNSRNVSSWVWWWEDPGGGRVSGGRREFPLRARRSRKGKKKNYTFWILWDVLWEKCAQNTQQLILYSIDFYLFLCNWVKDLVIVMKYLLLWCQMLIKNVHWIKPQQTLDINRIWVGNSTIFLQKDLTKCASSFFKWKLHLEGFNWGYLCHFLSVMQPFFVFIIFVQILCNFRRATCL